MADLVGEGRSAKALREASATLTGCVGLFAGFCARAGSDLGGFGDALWLGDWRTMLAACVTGILNDCTVHGPPGCASTLDSIKYLSAAAQSYSCPST